MSLFFKFLGKLLVPAVVFSINSAFIQRRIFEWIDYSFNIEYSFLLGLCPLDDKCKLQNPRSNYGCY